MCGNARLLDTRSRLHLALLAQLVTRACPAGGISHHTNGSSSRGGSRAKDVSGKLHTQASQFPSQLQSQLPGTGTASDRRSNYSSSSTSSSGWESSGAATPWEWLFNAFISALDADDASVAALSGDTQQSSGKGLSNVGTTASGSSVGGNGGVGIGFSASSSAASQRVAGNSSSGLVRGGALSRSRGGSGLRLVSLRCLPLLQLLAAVLELFPNGEAWLGPAVTPGQGAGSAEDNTTSAHHAHDSRRAQHLSTLASIVQVLSVRVLDGLASSPSLAQSGGGGSSAGGFGAALQYWTVLALSQAAKASSLAIGRFHGRSSSQCRVGEVTALAQLETHWQQVWSCAVNSQRPYLQAMIACEPGSLGEAVCALLAQLAASGLTYGSANSTSSNGHISNKHALAMQLVALPLFRPRANGVNTPTANVAARSSPDSDDNTQTAAAAASSSGSAPTAAAAVLPSCAPFELAAIALQLLHESGAAEDAHFDSASTTDAASNSSSSSSIQMRQRCRSSHSDGQVLFNLDSAPDRLAAALSAAPQPTESPRACLLASLLWHVPRCLSAGPASLAALPSLRKALAIALAPQRMDQGVSTPQAGCCATDAPGACDDPVALPAALGQAPSAASVLLNVGSSSSSSNKVRGGIRVETSDGGYGAESDTAATAAAAVPLLQRTLANLSDEVARHARTVVTASAAAADDFEDNNYASGRSLLSRPCLVALFGLSQCARLLISLRPAVLYARLESVESRFRDSGQIARVSSRVRGASANDSSAGSVLTAWDNAIASAVDSIATCLLQHPGWALDEALGASCCLARGGGLAAVWSPISVLEAVVRPQAFASFNEAILSHSILLYSIFDYRIGV